MDDHLAVQVNPQIARPILTHPTSPPLACSQVHLSQATLQFLKDGEFEVTPGDGASRDEYLEKHGMVTYLIQQGSENQVDPTTEASGTHSG